MGFLSDAANQDDPNAPPQQDAPAYGGFLSDNPPPAPPPPVAQAPSWSEIPKKALVNAPGSAMQFGENLYHTVRHPIDTLESIGNLALGTMQKAGLMAKGDTEANNYEKYPEALGKMVVDRYGSVDNFKKTLATDPVGAAADISTLLLGPEAALSKVPYLGKAATVARAATDPLTVPIGAAKLAGKAGALTLGYDSGAGYRNIEEAARAGHQGSDTSKAFRASQEGLTSPEDIVNMANNAKKNLLKERGLDYETGMIPVKNSNTQLSFADIGQAMTDAHKITTFKGEPLNLNPGVQRALERADDQIIKWVQLNPAEFHTPLGFDALKKSMGTLRDQFEVGTPEWKAINGYYKATDNTIRKQVPEYGKVMKDYADFSNEINQIEKTFSMPRDQGKLVYDTALRKLQSIMRKNVNTNFGQRENLANVLEEAGAPNLKAALAGQALSSPEAHGLVRLIPALKSLGWTGLKEAATALGIGSPYAAGRVAHGLGVMARPFKYLPPKSLQAAQEIGRWVPQEKRGGRIDRAMRAARRHHG
jgi:hypothetical protein